MFPAKVIGKAISTVRHPSLKGQRLLIVQPLMLDGHSPEGFPQICLDSQVGARVGDRVLISSDGSLIGDQVQSRNCPARWSVLGILDD
ncbi:MAG: EutN/CcmL family microcompartment protein [Thermoguttaceae bacterium]|nr:EutN/CcmL family microcompartment protein [Thermoguttaceae bacterium]MBQ9455289.1 EutN/CcmL family microcompartment protein [Thermoguttaceae bacterium]MDO4859327.1 EutN/CcmL family microcompartment protein [Thermoguttaceae bacterium]